MGRSGGVVREVLGRYVEDASLGKMVVAVLFALVCQVLVVAFIWWLITLLIGVSFSWAHAVAFWLFASVCGSSGVKLDYER